MISILLATYNGERYIHQSINSIISQTFEDWELLVGFNGTTDQSKSIVSNYNDNRIKIFDYGSDKGKSKTLNKLIKEAEYDWCAIQDDDDIWLSHKLESQLNFMERFDVIGGYIRYIDENNNVIGGPQLGSTHKEIKEKTLSGVNQIANCTSLFKKSAVLDVGCWDSDLDELALQGIQPKEDFDLWVKLLKRDFLFHNVSSYLALHRIHDQSNFNTKKHDISNIL